MSTIAQLNKFNVADKGLIKRVFGAVKTCLQMPDEQTAAELVAKFKNYPTFEKLWNRLASKYFYHI